MNRIVAYEIEIRYKRAEVIVQKRPVTKILQRISISCPTRVCPDAREGLINSPETVGGFRGASEDAAAPNGLCPPELLISVSLEPTALLWTIFQ